MPLVQQSDAHAAPVTPRPAATPPMRIPRAPRRQLLLEASTYTNVRGAVVDIPYFVYEAAPPRHAHVDVRDAHGHLVHARHLAEPVELQVESLTACVAQCLFVLWYAVLVAALVVEVVPSAQWSMVNVCGARYDAQLWREERWSSDMCLYVTPQAAAAAGQDGAYATVQWRGRDVAAAAATLNQFRRIALSVASPLYAAAQRAVGDGVAVPSRTTYHLQADVALRHARTDGASDGEVVSSFRYPVTVRCHRDRARCAVALVPLDVHLGSGSWSALNVTLVDVPAALAQALTPRTTASLPASTAVGIAFQRSAYTLGQLVWRYTFLFLSLLHTLRFIARSRYTGSLYEQRWVLLLQLALFWYLDPLYALVVVTDPLPSVLAFVHYRVPTLFFAVLASFMFAVVTASMTWSRHDGSSRSRSGKCDNTDTHNGAPCMNSNGHHDSGSGSGSGSSDTSDDEKCCFCTLCWWGSEHDGGGANACASASAARRALRRRVWERHGLYDPPCWTKVLAVVFVLVIVAFNVIDAAVANQSWLSPSNSGTFSAGYITLHALLLAAALVCIVLLFYLRYSLGKKPYLETRPQQLASRVFLFVFTAVVLYLLLHTILFFAYYNAAHPALRTLQPFIQLPVLMVVTFAVNVMTLVYTNRGRDGGGLTRATGRSGGDDDDDDDDDGGGVPVHARDPRWRRMVWPDRWYRYLARHGGSQYIFLVERDETRFYRVQYSFRRRQLMAQLKRAHASRELHELLVWSRSSRQQHPATAAAVSTATTAAPSLAAGVSCRATPTHRPHHDESNVCSDSSDADVAPPAHPLPAVLPTTAATAAAEATSRRDAASAVSGVSRELSRRMLNMDYFSTYYLPEQLDSAASPTAASPTTAVPSPSPPPPQQQQWQQHEPHTDDGHGDGRAATAAMPSSASPSPAAVGNVTCIAVHGADVAAAQPPQQHQPPQQQNDAQQASTLRFAPLLRRTLHSTRRHIGLLAEAAERNLVRRPVRTYDRLETHLVDAVYRPFQSTQYLPFFTLETAIDCLNMSWEVYYPPAASSSSPGACIAASPTTAAALPMSLSASNDEATARLRVLDVSPLSRLRGRDSGDGTAAMASPSSPRTTVAAAAVRCMNVEQYGYTLVHVAMAKNVQALIAVMDTTVPQHRGKAPRVLIAFRGTTNMSNARHDMNLRRVTWHEMCHTASKDTTTTTTSRASDTVQHDTHYAPHTCATRDTARGNGDAACGPQRNGSVSDEDDEDEEDADVCCCCCCVLCHHESCCAPCAHSRACRLRWRPTAHAGFVVIWRALSPLLLPRLQQLLCGDQATVYRVFVTGHSMGGALAALCAYSVSRLLTALHYPIPDVTVYTFGQPRFCNRAFQQRYNRAVPRTFSVQNEDDVVATMRVCGGCHVGVEVDIDRHGNYVVHPTVMERLFRPTTGRGLAVINHNLASYGNSLDALAAHSPCRARAFRPYVTAREQRDEHAREHHHHDHRAGEAAAHV